jgi:hypothetical protein
VDYTEILVTFTTAVLVPALTIVGKNINQWLKEKANHEKLKKCVAIVNDCVTDSVGEIAQTYTSKLPTSEWNEEAKKRAFELARNSVLESMGADVKQTIEKNIGNFDSWLKSKIETEVNKQNINQITGGKKS